MSCPLKNRKLAPIASGETWAGLTFAVTSSDDTEYGETLTRVRMTWKNSAGVAALTLDSNTAGQITITTATPYAWDFTVEPVALSIPAGVYSWAIETTGDGGTVDKDRIAGTQQITTDPHA
jgi:hypothetical protein